MLYNPVIALLLALWNLKFRIQRVIIVIIVTLQNLLANHEGLPRHNPLSVLRAEVIPAQDGMYVQVPDMLSGYGLDTSSESAFAQATMHALDKSDCPLLLEGEGCLLLSV
jgi:hypothetical protein